MKIAWLLLQDSKCVSPDHNSRSSGEFLKLLVGVSGNLKIPEFKKA